MKYGSESGMVLIHKGDDKNDLNKLEPKIAHIFNLNLHQIKLVQEGDFVVVQPKK